MDSGERTKPEVIVRTKGVTVETLGIIIGSAILGAAVALSIVRVMQGGTETIPLTGLLGFFLTLGLSVSAIVLAVTAISLSRTAERTIAKKSEEMSSMQTAMIAQTAAAIDRMESSVVRIGEEITDTIYDNFEMLSEEIYESLPSRDVLRADVTEAVERSLSGTMSVTEQPEEPAVIPEEIPAAAPEPEVIEEEKPVAVIPVPEPEPPVQQAPKLVTAEMREKADKRYGEFKDIVLLGVANYPGVLARKVGEGQYRTEGDDLVDGVFIINNEKVAVCTFCTNDIITDRFMSEGGESFNVFLRSLVGELKKGHFTRIFLVFDGKLTNASLYARALNGLSGHIAPETFAGFELFEGTPNVIIPELTERVSQLMDAACETAAEEEQEMSFRRQASA
jgi:hypothetical protein